MSKVILDTDEIRLSKYFYKGEKKSDLLVLVEDKDDIPFWQRMFSCVSSKYRQIEVHSLHSAPKQYSSNGTLLMATGKGALMKIDVNTLGQNKMIAVDADYDLIINTHYTKRLKTGKYIVHTTYYSIENHLINDKNLANLEVWNYIGGIAHPWKNILDEFAKSVCPFVKLCISTLDYAIKEIAAGRTPSKCLEISTLHQEVNTLSFCASTFKVDDESWKKSMESKYGSIKAICPKEYAVINKKVTESTALHFLQGHTFYDYISKVIKNYITEDLRSQVSKINSNTSLPKDERIRQIQTLLAKVYNGRSRVDCVHESIYNANAIDFADTGIVGIQKQIKTLC
ncbi:MAG: DUF4435 domain-containing protein [Bacteroidaceae bacterium]|nr:DUF4435 domain-containing protein [Bacteroidaceae bacterium]